MTDQALLHCPVADRDDRKSAAVAMAAGVPGQVVREFDATRRLLRNPEARQAGFLADLVTKVSLTRAPILYQHGAEHRRQRGATARFFAPRVVTTAYRTLMERTSDELVGRLRAGRRGRSTCCCATCAPRSPRGGGSGARTSFRTCSTRVIRSATS